MTPLRHGWLKGAVFALLAWNTAILLRSGTAAEALDAASWLALLALFEAETDFGDRLSGTWKWAAAAIRPARLVAAVAVCMAALGYVHDEAWLDAANSGLWIAVVVLLEVQVRYRAVATRYRAWFLAATTALFACLGALALAWFWQGEWFDAYDAAIWLAALAIIEMNVLRSRPALTPSERRSPA